VKPYGPTETEPRLFDVTRSGAYLGVSPWTIRSLVANVHLRPVKLPACHRRDGNGRRLLFDKRDLDAFVDARRHA